MNKDCPDYGKKGTGNILLKERYGKQNRALLLCKTCKHCFSETRGTVFFGLDTPQKEVLRTLAIVPEKGDIGEQQELWIFYMLGTTSLNRINHCV